MEKEYGSEDNSVLYQISLHEKIEKLQEKLVEAESIIRLYYDYTYDCSAETSRNITSHKRARKFLAQE